MFDKKKCFTIYVLYNNNNNKNICLTKKCFQHSNVLHYIIIITITTYM